MDYELTYKILFNPIERERIISPDIERAKRFLKQAQQATEDMFIGS